MRRESFDSLVSQADQLKTDHQGPVILIGTYTCAPEHKDEMMESWIKRGQMMREQPGLVSVQLHRAIGDANVLVNVAVWESLDALRAARKKAAEDPLISDNILSRAILVEKIAVPGVCVA
jgi:quinol monooxygenase YgiN